MWRKALLSVIMCNPGVDPRTQIEMRHCPGRWRKGANQGSVGMKARWQGRHGGGTWPRQGEGIHGRLPGTAVLQLDLDSSWVTCFWWREQHEQKQGKEKEVKATQ